MLVLRLLAKNFCYLGLILICLVFSNCSSIRLTKDVSQERSRTQKTKTRTKPKVIDTASESTSTTAVRQKIIRSAMQYSGIEYVYGGKSPSGFDCSGFTSYVFKENGIVLRGASKDQAILGKPKQLRNAEPGDLIYFKNKGKVVHVSIVVDKADDQLWVVHSTSSRGVVKDEILHSTYWKPRIAGVRDVLTDD